MTPKEIEKLKEHYNRSMDLAHEWGLTPYEVDFHVVPADKMYEIASYGIPGHFGHWTYGRDYWKQKTGYDYGQSKIYELVINADPAQAFLLENNSLLENMFVISHVIGHSDFFSNNQYFAHTNTDMISNVSAMADRHYKYETEYGRLTVESFIDDVFTIREHVDPFHHMKPKSRDYEMAYAKDDFEDMFPEIEKDRRTMETLERVYGKHAFPYEPERDLVQFLAEHGRLDEWQRDLMLGIRDESLYFLPQMQTKIMNEGWASIVHRRMMHELDPDCDPGGLEFSTMHAGVLSGRPGPLNPYWLGFNVYQRIIDLYGWEAALDVREIDSDESFLRNYIDEKICEDLDLFAYAFNDPEKLWEITDKTWEDVRDVLVETKVNMGQPYIEVVDADYDNQGILFLRHVYNGQELLRKYTFETLKAVERLWGRPVKLETQGVGANGEEKIFNYTCVKGQIKEEAVDVI